MLEVLDFKAVGRRDHRQLKMTRRRQVVKQVDEIGLKREDAIDRSKWHNAVNKLLRIMR